MDHYDVIIIGSGAGGGTLARHLAPSGKRVLVLTVRANALRVGEHLLARMGLAAAIGHSTAHAAS